MKSKSTIRELFQALFSNRQAMPAPADSLAQAHSEIAELRVTVFDLLVEVEAIREALLKSPLGSGGARAPYAIAYREAALLTHNAAGPTGGHQKLLDLFYPSAHEQSDWRECLFMQRLGFSVDEIAKYKEKAEEVETYT